jgi:hypothetical protein
MKLHLFSSFLGKARMATVALGGLLLVSGAPAAKANDWDDCNRRAAYADHRYHEAVEHSGPYSSSARHWAHERHEALERCARYNREWREHHRDWDRR